MLDVDEREDELRALGAELSVDMYKRGKNNDRMIPMNGTARQINSANVEKASEGSIGARTRETEGGLPWVMGADDESKRGEVRKPCMW